MAVSELARRAKPRSARLPPGQPGRPEPGAPRTTRLKHVAGMANWGKDNPPTIETGAPRSGRGIACGIYKDAYISYVADVRVGAAGQVRGRARLLRRRLRNLAINPDLVRAQIEGCIVWAIGMTLSEGFAIEDGAPAPENFDSYELPRITADPGHDHRARRRRTRPPRPAWARPAWWRSAPPLPRRSSEATGKPVRRLPIKDGGSGIGDLSRITGNGKRAPTPISRSASLVGLVARAVRRLDPDLLAPAPGGLDAVRQARACRRATSATCLAVLWRKAGAEALLSIGQGIREADFDPLWRHAMRAASPAILLDKWRRVEVFGHSRNRLRIELTSDRQRIVQPLCGRMASRRPPRRRTS